MIVAVGRRRDQIGRVVEARFGRRVYVLDDGFQHLRLQRDLDIVCVHPRDLGDRPLPGGRLRETASALRRAQVILWSGEAPPCGRERAELGGASVYGLRRRVVGFRDRDGGSCEAPTRVFLLSGIAQPERFREDVAGEATVLGVRSFADHHAYARAELEQVFAEARSLRADAVVTTQKDATRLQTVPDGPPLRVLRIEAVVDDVTAFRTDVLRVAVAG